MAKPRKPHTDTVRRLIHEWLSVWTQPEFTVVDASQAVLWHDVVEDIPDVTKAVSNELLRLEVAGFIEGRPGEPVAGVCGRPPKVYSLMMGQNYLKILSPVVLTAATHTLH